ncbi:MAG: hypothetical protein E3J72_13530 [Planctomycetota bacterium]|nr:MAG: hypothetical protein E3J72_13530 [Planctomycetota bacterium]
MIRRAVQILPALLFVACVFSGGCGYTIGSTWPDARTIEVPIFRRAIVSGRSSEFELTKAVQDEITSRDNIKIVRRGGELRLEGEITTDEERVVTPATIAGGLEERVLTITVNLVLIDKRNNTQVQRTVSEDEPFSFIRGENEASAREKAIREIARKIYFQFEEW